MKPSPPRLPGTFGALLALIALAGPGTGPGHAQVIRVVGKVPETPDPPVLLVPARDPWVVADLRKVSLRNLAALRDDAGPFGMQMAFALGAAREAMGANVEASWLEALVAGMPQADAQRLRNAHARFSTTAFGRRRFQDHLVDFPALARRLETLSEGHAWQGNAPLVSLRDTGPGDLRAFLARILEDPQNRSRMDQLAASTGGLPAAPPAPTVPGPEPGFDGLSGAPPVPGPSAGLDAAGAIEAVARLLEAAHASGVDAWSAVGRLTNQLASARLEGSSQAGAQVLAELLADGIQACRAAVLARPEGEVLVVVDLNQATPETLAQAGVPQESIPELMNRRGRIGTLSEVAGLLGPALAASQARVASISQVMAPELARSVYERIDPRDPFERAAAPLSASDAQSRLGPLAAPEAMNGPGEGYFVFLEDVPLPFYVKVHQGRVVAMTPAPRNADGGVTAVGAPASPGGTMPTGPGQAALPPMPPRAGGDIGRHTVIEPVGQGMYRVVPEGDPQRAALDEAFRVPYVDHDVDLLALHRRTLLGEPAPQGAAPENLRRVIFEGTLLVVLEEGASVHSAAGRVRIQNRDGSVVQLDWAPRLVIPLKDAALFQARRDGELPMLLTHEIAHVAMFDRWQGTSQTYRNQGKVHGNEADRYLSGRLNALVEGWAEAWAVVMGRDPQVQQAFRTSPRWIFHDKVDKGWGPQSIGTTVLDGHTLLANEYVLANAIADTLESQEWSQARSPAELASVLPRGATARPAQGGWQVVDAQGTALMNLSPRDLGRLRGLRAFFPRPGDIVAWIANSGREDAARGRRAGAEFLAAARYQPLAARGGEDLGAFASRELSGADREARSAQVMSGAIPFAGPWPRVGPELYVYSDLPGVADDFRAMDLNRWDDPSYGKVLGLALPEYEAIAQRRAGGRPFGSHEEAYQAFPARLQQALRSWRQLYRQKFPEGP